MQSTIKLRSNITRRMANKTAECPYEHSAYSGCFFVILGMTVKTGPFLVANGKLRGAERRLCWCVVGTDNVGAGLDPPVFIFEFCGTVKTVPYVVRFIDDGKSERGDPPPRNLILIHAWNFILIENNVMCPLAVPKILCSLFASQNFDRYANSHSLYPPLAAVVFLAPSLFCYAKQGW